MKSLYKQSIFICMLCFSDILAVDNADGSFTMDVLLNSPVLDINVLSPGSVAIVEDLCSFIGSDYTVVPSASLLKLSHPHLVDEQRELLLSH